MEGICKDCGKFRKWLHKHHLKPKADGGTDEDGIVIICANCHEDRHEGPFGGRTMREARSRAKKRHWKNPGFRKKQLKAMSKTWRPAYRRKVMKKLWADPTYRLKQVHAQKAAWKKDEKRRKHRSVISKRLWKRKSYRENLVAFHSKHSKKSWANASVARRENQRRIMVEVNRRLGRGLR